MPDFVLPEKLNSLIRGFQASRVLLTAIELDIFGQLGAGATAGEVAQRIETNPRATEMLLNALVAFEALDKTGDRFLPKPFCELLTGERRVGWLHTAHLWTSWSQLTRCVRTGSPAQVDEIARREPGWQQAFIAAMENSAIERAPLVADALGGGPIHKMLDVGGGSAAYSIAFARKHPELEATVFDLPEILPITSGYIDAAEMRSQLRMVAGDLRTDRFGEGYDLVLLSAICHMLSEEENLDLLKRCRAALVSGGRIVIQEFFLNDSKTGPIPATLFSLNMLIGTAGGAAYSTAEYSHWLQLAGFNIPTPHPLPGPTGLLIATAR